MRRRTGFMIGLVALAMAGTLVGCGGDDDSGGKSTGGTSSGGTSSGGTSSGGTSSGGTSSGGSSTGGASTGGTSSGNGLAAKYPGDQGIETDPDVIFADDFESYADATKLWDRYDNTFQQSLTRIATETGNFYAGKQAVEFTLPASTDEVGNAVIKNLSPELDAMYLRWYSKFDPNFDVVGSSHNGGGMSSHYDGPGVPADGTNKFLVEFEHGRFDAATPTPGILNVYVYHPEQRDVYGDHFMTTGLVSPNTSLPYDFGADFVPHPDVIPELDRWYCYELMVKANTPGQRDGRITLWLDGEKIGDFGNLRLRDVPTLTLDRFNVGFHAKSNPKETKKYYDNIVAAKSYIGPMVAQ